MMRNTLFVKKPNYFARLFMLLVLSVMICDLAAANNTKTFGTQGFHDSILVKISFTRIAGKIKLFPNMTSEVLYFTAFGDERKPYSFFLFDMSGKLVNHAHLRDAETTLLSISEKGNYMFEVFNNDDRLEYGSIVVK